MTTRAARDRGRDPKVSETVIFSNIRADLLMHRHHFVANWRAGQGRTIWIDSLGSRNPRLRDIRRLRGEGAGQLASGGLRGVAVLKSRTVPLHGSEVIYRLNARLLERRIKELRVTPETAVAWVYLAHPVVLEVLQRFEWGRIVFDLCDEISDFRGIHPRMLSAEAELLQMADVVFASSADLYEKALRARGDRVNYVPNGVDFARFARVKPPNGRVRVLTYIGSVFEWFDEELVATVASERPDLRFRIIGPVRRPLRRLKLLPNVEVRGPIAAEEVPHAMERSDLCIIPFRPGPLVRATDPLKVYEALAAGRPVLATNLPQASRFAPAVRLETSSTSWLEAIRDLEEGRWKFNPEATREAVRKREDWQLRFQLMGPIVEAGGLS